MPHARQAILCPSHWPGQVRITNKMIAFVRGSPETLGLPPAAQPSPAASAAQLSPPLPLPTPSTSTCMRRTAEAKARGESPRSLAKKRQVDGSRTGLVGGRVRRACMGCATAGPALVRLCCTQKTTSGAARAQRYANRSEECTVKVSPSSSC